MPLVFLAMWLIHYGNRGFLFPLRMRVARGDQGSFSLMVITVGWMVTSLHGYFHASYFTRFGTQYTTDWLRDPRFLCGFVIYYSCFALNLQSDAIIRRLRTREEIDAGIKNYRIPEGGLFRWVTSPSYLTELGAWAGFALCTWSLAGVFIFVISLGNLVPRAFATQRWYRDALPRVSARAQGADSVSAVARRGRSGRGGCGASSAANSSSASPSDGAGPSMRKRNEVVQPAVTGASISRRLPGGSAVEQRARRHARRAELDGRAVVDEERRRAPRRRAPRARAPARSPPPGRARRCRSTATPDSRRPTTAPSGAACGRTAASSAARRAGRA